MERDKAKVRVCPKDVGIIYENNPAIEADAAACGLSYDEYVEIKEMADKLGVTLQQYLQFKAIEKANAEFEREHAVEPTTTEKKSRVDGSTVWAVLFVAGVAAYLIFGAILPLIREGFTLGQIILRAMGAIGCILLLRIAYMCFFQLLEKHGSIWIAALLTVSAVICVMCIGFVIE